MLEIKELEKTFGKKIVLDNISITFKEGVYGILGENGAGKTTLFRCITHLEKKYRGSIQMDKKCRLSYLSQNFGLLDELSVWDTLEYISLVRDKKEANKEELKYLLDLLNLYDQREKKVGQLSGGMLRRLGIVQAFMGEREVILLDEPTAGLDPEERLRFKRALKQLKQGKLILLSTHLLNDVEDVCEKVIVLHEGKISFVGSTEELVNMAAGKVYLIPENEISKIEGKFFLVDITENHRRILTKEKLQQKTVKPTIEDGYLCIIKNV